MVQIVVEYPSLQIEQAAFLQFSNLFAHLEGTALFYSGGCYSNSQTSFLALFPSKKISIPAEPTKNPWQSLAPQFHFDSSQVEYEFPEWVGYLSYEMGAFSDESKNISFYPPSIPLALFFKPSLIFALSHETKRLKLFITKEYKGESFDEARLVSLLEKSKSLSSKKFPTLRRVKEEEKETFLNHIRLAKHHILQGDIYQVNLSHQTLFQGEICPFSFYRKVLLKNPTPFSAFLQCPNFSLICTSPERLLKKKGDFLETAPIKGTQKRGISPAEDYALKQSLLTSPKERAELLMITDLMRNDLGKISLPGTVKTHELYRLETYQNVFHLSSLITSEVAHVDCPLEILRAVFPGGSISGCPKLRALEIIYEIEKRPRGIYTGSIGYFTNKKNFDFNIAIRTCLYQDNILDIQLGAGIVADSIPEMEYLETLHKGATLFEAASNP